MKTVLLLLLSVIFESRLRQLKIDKWVSNIFIVKFFFSYSTARRRRPLSSRNMYMFSRHRKLDFCKIISFISGLECLQKFDNLQKIKEIEENYDVFTDFPAISVQTTRNCRTAARKFSVLQKV